MTKHELQEVRAAWARAREIWKYYDPNEVDAWVVAIPRDMPVETSIMITGMPQPLFRTIKFRREFVTARDGQRLVCVIAPDGISVSIEPVRK